jgi:hypothetical protein
MAIPIPCGPGRIQLSDGRIVDVPPRSHQIAEEVRIRWTDHRFTPPLVSEHIAFGCSRSEPACWITQRPNGTRLWILCSECEVVSS